MERLHPRVRWLWILGAAVPAGILGAIATGVAAALSPAPLRAVGDVLPIGAGVAATIFVLGVAHAILRFRAFGFEVQDDALYIERGVLTKVNTVVPYVRVQHVDTQRSPVERAAGLGRVVVFTAGSRGADVSIPGLPPDRGTDLQAELRRLAGESEPDDAV